MYNNSLGCSTHQLLTVEIRVTGCGMASLRSILAFYLAVQIASIWCLPAHQRRGESGDGDPSPLNDHIQCSICFSTQKRLVVL